jgi:hypothetical protein
MGMSKFSIQPSIANKCPACNKEFESFGDRQRHLVTEHLQYGDLSWLHKNTQNKYKQEIRPIEL